ncbi:MAG: hypothetical protein ACKESC_00430 [Candidatus Hodgkinia cicadicola]
MRKLKAKSSVSELEIVEGLQIDKGYISSYFFINNSENGLWIRNAVRILIWPNKYLCLYSLLPLLEAVVQSNKSLIIADDIEGKH